MHLHLAPREGMESSVGTNRGMLGEKFGSNYYGEKAQRGNSANIQDS